MIEITEAIKKQLDEAVRINLTEHSIWQGRFFRALKSETDPYKVLRLLNNWTMQMPHASYGFQNYVLNLAARAQDEGVRKLLVDNLIEELGRTPDGTDHYPELSHFQMVCSLNRLIGTEESLVGHEHSKLLPTSREHVAKHTDLCRDVSKDFFEGLGALFLIENLTKEEFQRVMEAYADTWPKGSDKGIGYFEKGGGRNYFLANIGADAKHADDVAQMIQTAIAAEGVDISNSEEVRPFIQRVIKGMQFSINCRINFVEGVYEATERELNGLPWQGQRREILHIRIPRPGGPYFITALPGNLIEISRGEHTITFSMWVSPTAHSEETNYTYGIIPEAKIRYKDIDRGRINLQDCARDIGEIARDFAIVASNSQLPQNIKSTFAQFAQSIEQARA